MITGIGGGLAGMSLHMKIFKSSGLLRLEGGRERVGGAIIQMCIMLEDTDMAIWILLVTLFHIKSSRGQLVKLKGNKFDRETEYYFKDRKSVQLTATGFY